MSNNVVSFERDPKEELKDLLEEVDLDDFVFVFFTGDGEFRVTSSKLNAFEIQGMLTFTKHIMNEGIINGDE